MNSQVPGVAAFVSIEVLNLLDRAGRLIHSMNPNAVTHVIRRVEEVAVRADIASVDARPGIVGRIPHHALQCAGVIHRDGQAGTSRAVGGAIDGIRGCAGYRDVVGVRAVRGQGDVVHVSQAQIISNGVSLEVACRGDI